MKKYLQYNVTQYTAPANDVRVGQPRRATPISPGPGTQHVLDLSAKSDVSAVAMVTGRTWNSEQEAAPLDLSGYSRQQDEALDLSKQSTQTRNNGFNQSRPLSHPNHQSNPLMHTPPNPRHSRSPAGQSYSLLQAALNSSQSDGSSTDRTSQPMTLFDSRSVLFGGNGAGDSSRSIKPFSSARPLVPHMALANSSGAIIQGLKPIAITTPQPHNPPVNTKSQSVSDTTVSVTDANQSISSTCNQGFSVSQSNYSSAYPGQILSSKLGVAKAVSQLNDSSKRNHQMIERFMLQNPDNFPGHLLSGSNVMSPDILNGFSCTQCPKVFKTKAAMKLHMTVHKTTEERQYGCQVCQRRFLHRHHLVVHQRKHSGEKPFKCNACSKTFMAIFLLHKHLRKHARETGSVSDVSMEQLKQLQEEKLISTGPQPLTYTNLPPVSQGQGTVIVLEEAVSGSSGKTPDSEVVKERQRKIGEVIGEVNKDRSHGEIKLPVLKNSTVCGIDPNKPLSSTLAATTPNSVIPGDKKSDNSETNKPSISKETEPITDTKHDIKQFDKPGTSDMTAEDNSAGLVLDVKEEPNITDTHKASDVGVTEVKVEEMENPFPEYTSDDEVELDFNTGELIVRKREKHDESETTVEKNSLTKDTDKSICLKEQEHAVKSKASGSKVCEDKVKMETADDDIESKLEEDSVTEETSRYVKMEISDDTAEAGEGEKNKQIQAVEAAAVKSTAKDELKNDEIGQENKNVKNEVVDIVCVNESQTEETEKHVQEVVNDMKDELCAREEMLSKSLDKTFAEALELKETNSARQENIFEKIYESVKDPCFEEKTNDVKSKKGKKKGRKVKCEICSRTFHSNHYLLLHMAVHKRNPMLQSLKKAKANQMKMMGFVNKTNVACEVCNKVFKFQKSLNSHMRVHSEKLIERKLYRKAFREFVSGATPQSVSKAEKKSRKSEGSESQEKISEVKVRLSLESSTSETNRKTEDTVPSDSADDEPPIKIIIGDDNVKRYLCHACDNTYTTKQKLRLHALIHKDNCFLCDICGKSFFRQLTLEKHISTHKLPRPHVCELCKKSFIHRSSLMRHKAAHEKPVSVNVKQQLSDFSFEMKMRDTYTMLQEERLQQTQRQSSKSEMITSIPKYNPLDLTVKIKSEEQCLPPVLSPANIPTPQSSSWNLSPPLITDDPVDVKHVERLDSVNVDMEHVKNRLEMIQSAKSAVKRKARTESGCSESDVLSSDGNTAGPKKSRKTRVYQTSCRVCKEAFPNVMLLKSHMAVHNTVETHLYECHICRHRFTQSCSLLRHLKTSCQENRMKCVPCNKIFHRRNTYEQHMRLHEGGPSNLDGSFYDKRKDEAEVREERESDIENNNSSKVADVVVTPLTVENVTLFDEANNQSMKKEAESDAQTYLYSEGEVHSQHSDHSDGEGVSGSHSNIAVPQDLTKNTMTLNLLSAVCSELRNAEKEEELKRKELEEKQKELETIEILANLKRGAMQQASVDSSPVPAVETSKSFPISLSSPFQSSSQETSSVYRPSGPVLDQNTENRLPASTQQRTAIHPALTHSPLIRVSAPMPVPQKNIKAAVPTDSISHPRIPSVINTSTAPSGKVTIPTVVQDVTPDPEGPTLQKVPDKMLGRLVGPRPVSQSRASVLSKEAAMLQSLSQMRGTSPIFPVIQERLSLLMKAQVTSTASATPSSSSALPSAPAAATRGNQLMNSIPQTSANTGILGPSVPVAAPPRTVPGQQADPDVPQDLSVKTVKCEPTPPAHYIPTSLTKDLRPVVRERSLSAENRLRSDKPEGKLSHESLLIPRPEFDPRLRHGGMPIPPPLVSVYQCDLCSKVVYNKIDLHLHKVEHVKASGLDILSGKRRVPPLPEHNTVDKLLDFTQTDSNPAKHSAPRQDKATPPGTLDLSLKKIDAQSTKPSFSNQSGVVNDPDSPGSQQQSSSASKTPEKLSPVSPLDPGESVSSPSSSMALAGNLDQLRQDLRHKIFSRRKSQGLEDLKVEFKAPEPTEMTEEERLKLLYRRECNRQAAQRSRMRKKDLVDNLLEELHTEEVIQLDLQERLKSLVAEKNTLLKVLQSHMCVKDKSQHSKDSCASGQGLESKADGGNDVGDDDSMVNVDDKSKIVKLDTVLDIKRARDHFLKKSCARRPGESAKPDVSRKQLADIKSEPVDTGENSGNNEGIDDKEDTNCGNDNDGAENVQRENESKLFNCDNGSDLIAFKSNSFAFKTDCSDGVAETVRHLVDKVELTVGNKARTDELHV